MLKPATSSDYPGCGLRRDVDEPYASSGELYNMIIENAGGVPYQLVFGASFGEGSFVNNGSGVKQLLGINGLELTEKLFFQMIEEMNLSQNDLHVNPVELREKILRGDIRKYNAELLVITQSGDKKWLKDSSVVTTDEKTGLVTGLSGIFFDITGQIETGILLEKTMEKATESDRLKTAFLNNLSHEIRTPLNAIVGFSTLMVEPGGVPGNRIDFMDIITHSSDHLLEIVDDVLEISKIETRNVRIIRKEVNLDQMLQRLYERFRVSAEEKNVILNYEARSNGSELVITTDGYKLFQSINNLLSNAVKFTREGKVEFGYSIKKNMIEFYVTDTGVGIGPEHQPNIFKPFYQAESSSTKRYEGTGLGLSIARAYIELLGGSMWFNSEPGEGSVFCFNIPDTRISLA